MPKYLVRIAAFMVNKNNDPKALGETDLLILIADF